MIELLNVIKDTQAKMEGLYKKYISPDSKSRSMVSIYNENSNMTVNGAKAVDVCKEIEQINDDIVSTTEKLRSLTAIKEQINSTCRTKIIDLDGNTVEYTIAQLLMISSPKIKKYHLDYLNKLEKDYQDAGPISSFKVYYDRRKDIHVRYCKDEFSSYNRRSG